MIIETTQHTEHGVIFNRLTSASNYWGVGYNPDLTVVITASGNPLMTVPEYDEEGVMIGGWLAANTSTDSMPLGFGADTFQELWDEIKARGLILPQEVLEHLETIGYT